MAGRYLRQRDAYMAARSLVGKSPPVGCYTQFHASGAYGQWDTHVRGAKGGTMVAADQAVQTVDRVADFFILQVDEEAGDVMTSLRLQKLVYYAQSWHLALAGMPLFEEEFEAWVHGPVVPSLYFKYRGMSNASLPRPDGPPPEFVQRSLEILNDVWDEYGQYSAKRLEELTHAEDPWKDARRGHSPAELSNQVIPKDAMRVFYAARLPG